MPASHQYIFSTEEVEAISKALENSGVGSGDWHGMLESFGNAQSANAAKRVRNALRGKAGRAAASGVVTTADYLLDPEPEDIIEEHKERIRLMSNELRDLRNDLRDLLGELKATRRALDNEHYSLAADSVESAIQCIELAIDN